MGRPVFQVIPGAALQTFPIRSQNGLFQHISGRIIGILHPSVDTVLYFKDSLLGQAVVRIVASVDLGALRGGDLCQVAVGIVFADGALAECIGDLCKVADAVIGILGGIAIGVRRRNISGWRDAAQKPVPSSSPY